MRFKEKKACLRVENLNLIKFFLTDLSFFLRSLNLKQYTGTVAIQKYYIKNTEYFLIWIPQTEEQDPDLCTVQQIMWIQNPAPSSCSHPTQRFRIFLHILKHDRSAVSQRSICHQLGLRCLYIGVTLIYLHQGQCWRHRWSAAWASSSWRWPAGSPAGSPRLERERDNSVVKQNYRKIRVYFVSRVADPSFKKFGSNIFTTRIQIRPRSEQFLIYNS